MAHSGAITVYVPYMLRAYCDGASQLVLSVSNVRGVLEELERRYPSLHTSICDETGAVRRHVNLFVNNSHIRDRQGLDTVLEPDDEIAIIPAVSGG